MIYVSVSYTHLYTAVTRAKKKVILVGHKPILFMAVHRADISKRNTMLGERIRLYCKAYHTERNALPELQQAGCCLLYTSRSRAC